MGKYKEEEIKSDLARQGIKFVGRSIDLTKSNEVVGIKTLGKVDFLMNHCGYIVYYPQVKQLFEYSPFLKIKRQRLIASALNWGAGV